MSVLLLLLAGMAGVVFYVRRRRKRQVQALAGRYFSSSMGEVYYEVSGQSGPYLLFIHGLGASTYCWRKVIPHFADDYRVILFDLWGFGRSGKHMAQPMSLGAQTAIISALLDHLKVGKCYVVGHSMGGHIALSFGLNYPDKVEKLVAIAPASHPQLVSNLIQKVTWIARFTPMVVSRRSIRRLLLGLLYDQSFVTEEMVDSYFAPYRDPKAHLSFAAALAIIRDVGVYNNLSSLQKSVLILWGSLDRVVPGALVRDVHRLINGCEFVAHDRAGHLIIEDDPQWVAEQITRFLKSR